jgi:hypothetical protein
MNNIEIGQRWVCIKNINFDTKYDADTKYNFKRFDYIDIINVGNLIRATKNGDESTKVGFTKKEIFDNFITQAEWREKQINLILDDE